MLMSNAGVLRPVLAVPAIVWAYNNVSLSRASQPMTGMFNSRSEHDEALVAALLADVDADADATSVKMHRLVICDARPKLNAISNKGKVCCWMSRRA
jgi:hypothetical protein